MGFQRNLFPDLRPVSVPEGDVDEGSQSLAGELKGWLRDIFFAALTAILVVVFIVQPVKVEGTSMEPKLEAARPYFR